MPRLIVIKGTDEGRQFALAADMVTTGRDAASLIRLTDTEVSRRHAEFLRTADGYRVRDVGSANGTYVNNQSIRDVLLQPGDHVQIGQTVLVYTLDRGESAPAGDLAGRINLISRQDVELSSAIVKAVGELEGSRIMAHPDLEMGHGSATPRPWGVLYEATQLISHTLDLEQLLDRILELIFRHLQADRACVLLRASSPLQEGYGAGPDPGPSSSGEFEPKAIRSREIANKDSKSGKDKITVSRTIIDYVLNERKGILVSDAARDERFQSVQSIVRSGVREVICVPMKGRHQTLGILYLDTSTPVAALTSGRLLSKFTGDHLSLAIAIAHQAALAVEETRDHQAMVNAERLAAVGQTTAALSHHIKNILQGLMMGGQIIEQGLQDQNWSHLQTGWNMVRKNNDRVQNLVMDMLSYSKEREPNVEAAHLNAIARDVVELMQPRAQERGVELSAALDASLPIIQADVEGIHRALLNVVTNAIDAVEEADNPQVVVRSLRQPVAEPGKGPFLRLEVKDNGPGISTDKLADIFRPFVSTKGSRGTGLGLAVSRKILREHGGDIVVESELGNGSTFILRLPVRSPLGDGQQTRTDIPAWPPEPD